LQYTNKKNENKNDIDVQNGIWLQAYKQIWP